jgi:uncharacterized protein (DUF302 family)
MSAKGIVRLASHHSVAVTLDRLESLLQERGVLVFARIDFSGDAAGAGMSMPAEQQLIFGSPKAGTPLMVANPVAALDLPLRAICWQDPDGQTWIAYNEPGYIGQRHELAQELTRNLAAVIPLIERAAAAEQATGG